MLGGLVAGVVRATGGKNATVDGLRVCRAGWFKMYGRGGTIYGDTFVTPRDPSTLSSGLIEHEKFHRDHQWRKYGLAFGAMYLAAEVTDCWIGKKPFNRYELAAEKASDWGGGYDRP
jgi:hypothetical protein